MTAEERAFVEGVRCAAMALASKFGACETEIENNPRLAIALARKGGYEALARCAEAGKRLGAAELSDDRAAVVDSGYDLNALASAAPSRIEE